METVASIKYAILNSRMSTARVAVRKVVAPAPQLVLARHLIEKTLEMSFYLMMLGVVDK